MNHNTTSHTTINHSVFSAQEENVSNSPTNGNQPDFSALYDQYAPVLLGVITKIIRDDNEAIALLETAFIKIHSQLDQFQPQKQPLFIWLLGIARGTALDALKKRTSVKASPPQLTTSGKIIVTPPQQGNTPSLSITAVNSQLNGLLDAVLFKNCTPEEAASSLGIPVGLARKQLRLALQQIQVSSND